MLQANLQDLFESYYHNPNLIESCNGMEKLLHENFEELTETRQYHDFEHFLDVARNSGKSEMPGMWYGMVWECWYQLKGLKYV